MKKSRSIIILSLFAFSIFSVFLFNNCGGEYEDSPDFNCPQTMSRTVIVRLNYDGVDYNQTTYNSFYGAGDIYASRNSSAGFKFTITFASRPQEGSECPAKYMTSTLSPTDDFSKIQFLGLSPDGNGLWFKLPSTYSYGTLSVQLQEFEEPCATFTIDYQNVARNRSWYRVPRDPDEKITVSGGMYDIDYTFHMKEADVAFLECYSN